MRCKCCNTMMYGSARKTMIIVDEEQLFIDEDLCSACITFVDLALDDEYTEYSHEYAFESITENYLYGKLDFKSELP